MLQSSCQQYCPLWSPYPSQLCFSLVKSKKKKCVVNILDILSTCKAFPFTTPGPCEISWIALTSSHQWPLLYLCLEETKPQGGMDSKVNNIVDIGFRTKGKLWECIESKFCTTTKRLNLKWFEASRGQRETMNFVSLILISKAQAIMQLKS